MMEKLRKTAALVIEVAQNSDSNLLLHKLVNVEVICCKRIYNSVFNNWGPPYDLTSFFG
jgi:hypothetical protein